MTRRGKYTTDAVYSLVKEVLNTFEIKAFAQATYFDLSRALNLIITTDSEDPAYRSWGWDLVNTKLMVDGFVHDGSGIDATRYSRIKG
ncbi:hypothetical protein J6590_084911 [Homalodisca vitripennis]|nr:hypothetical protein J6590_084911 [Homalodisca vitripennis]